MTTGLVSYNGLSSKEGSCNFCTRSFRDYSKKVWVIKSRDENRRMTIIICPECLKELKEQTE